MHEAYKNAPEASGMRPLKTRRPPGGFRHEAFKNALREAFKNAPPEAFKNGPAVFIVLSRFYSPAYLGWLFGWLVD